MTSRDASPAAVIETVPPTSRAMSADGEQTTVIRQNAHVTNHVGGIVWRSVKSSGSAWHVAPHESHLKVMAGGWTTRITPRTSCNSATAAS